MKEETKNFPKFDDIVFEFRNKIYGAYFLRKVYKKTMTMALVIGMSVVFVAAAVPLIASYYSKNKTKVIEKDVSMEMTDMNKPKDDVPPPPPPPPPPPAAIEQVKFTAPVVVDTVIEKVDLATTDDLVKTSKSEAVDTTTSNVEVKKDEKQDEEIEKKREVFVIVEEMPEFNGGEEAMRKFIAENTKYPPVARENNIQGKVFVRFVVTYDGTIDQVTVLRKVDPLLDEEAIRVVRAMPKWKPGKQRGKPVNVSFTVPIDFRLQ